MTESIAVKERERRSTAGSRMTSLVGQAAKDDDEFWNHSTWIEEEDGSFHESDEDSDARRDTFDSDFDDSEDEDANEANDDAGGIAAEEAEVLNEEKKEKRKSAASKRKIVDVVSAGRELMQKRKNAAQRKKALKGDGMNAGLVLNVPGSLAASSTTISKQKSVVRRKSALSGIPSGASTGTAIATTNSVPERKSARIRSSTLKTVSDRSNKSRKAKRSLPASSTNSSLQSFSEQQHQGTTATTTTTSGRGGKRGKRKFTQEELILEAVQVTEPENERWLLSRKRIQKEETSRAELKKKLMMGENNRDKRIVCKYNSKRGCYNTLTFPSMDHVPEIFTRPQIDENGRQLLLKQRQKENICVITGKKARYRDPKTGKGYHDLAAFKELRRRLAAGEKLEQCPILSEETGSSSRTTLTKKEDCPAKESQNMQLYNKSSPPIKKEIVKASNSTKENSPLLLIASKKEYHPEKEQNSKHMHDNPTTVVKIPSQKVVEASSKTKENSSSSSIKQECRSMKEHKKTQLQNKLIPSMDPSAHKKVESNKTKDKSSSMMKDKSAKVYMPLDEIKSASVSQNINPCDMPSKRIVSIVKNEIVTKEADISVVSNLTCSKLEEKLPVMKPLKKEHTVQLSKVIENISSEVKPSDEKNIDSAIKALSVTNMQNKSGSLTDKSNLKMESSPSDLITSEGAVSMLSNDKKKLKRKRSRSTSTDNLSSKKDKHEAKQNLTKNKVNSSIPLQPSSSNPIVSNSSLISPSLNQNLQQFVPAILPQYQNNATMTQYYPMGQRVDPNQPTIYHHTMNQLAQLTGQHQLYQPSHIDVSSLYAMNLSQQNTLSGVAPLAFNHSTMHFNNSLQEMLNITQLAYGGYPNASQSIYSQLHAFNNLENQKESKKDEERDKAS